MPWVNGTLTDTTVGEEFRNFNTEAANSAVYAKLLSRVKEFVCGFASAATPGGGLVGAATEGFIRALEVTRDTTAKTWTVTFSSATAFAITASGETTINGTLTGVAPDRYATVAGARFTCRIYEGSVPFTSGNTFTFTTTPSPLGLQTWDVISDTAKGTGSYCGNDDSSSAYWGDYLNLVTVTNNSATATKGNVVDLRFYAQSFINTNYYITFTNATTFVLRDSTGAQLGSSGTVGVPFSWGAEGSRMSFTVTAGSTAFTATGGSGISFTGDFFTIVPKSSTGSNTHLTRIIVLKSRGLAGDDEIYYTFSQRVGGAFARFYLGVAIHPAHNPLLGTFSQQYMSSVKRIRHAQLPSEGVPYYIIASGRHIYVLTNPVASNPDPQVLGAGFLLPHARPTAEEQEWPGFVGGTYTATTSGAGDPIPASASGPFYNGGGTSESVSVLSVVIPGTTIIWGYGANHAGGATIYGSGNTPATSQAYAELEVFLYPYSLNDLSASYPSIDSGVYGEPGTRKAIFPVSARIFGSTASGVIGEFPGLFFIGHSSLYPVSVGDTLGGGTHVIWRGTTANPNEISNSAAFALE